MRDLKYYDLGPSGSDRISVMGCWLEHESLTSTTLLKCALLLNNEQEVSVFCMYVIATYLA